MRKNLHSKLMLLLAAVLMGVGSVSAAEEVYKTALFGSDYNNLKKSSYTEQWSATNGDFTVNLENFNNNNNGWNYVKCGRKNNASVATITTAAAIDKAISKVVVTIDAITVANVNSIMLYTSSDNGSTWTVAGSFTEATGEQAVTLSSPAENLYYKVEFDCASGSSNGLVTVSKVEYYYVSGGNPNVPIINASDVNLTYDATSGEIAYSIDDPADGVTLGASTSADWVSNISVTGDKVTFTTTANEGNTDRTATFTLTYTGAQNKTVTVTQGHLEVDYATLPFSYDGNGTGTLPSGLTVSGTGTYDSSPKIKFDGTGDYMILKIGETPGKLSFNIKGNSFSGGTFKVQTSADGESYTDLQAYTSLSNTQSESFNLSGDVRYIKWIYTTKSSGNVALGNINLTKGVPVTITAAKYATFSSGDDVDFSKTGVTVYKAKVDTEKKVVKLTEVPDGIVPANTGVILYKDVDANTDVTVPVTTTDAAISENDLVATVTSTLVKKTEDDKNFNYIMQLSNETIVFNMATVDGAYMPAGKAYLSTTVDASTGNARLSVVFDDETAGIATVNVKKGESDHNAVYNLNGQRLAQPRKGLNIVNGKKMFVK